MTEKQFIESIIRSAKAPQDILYNLVSARGIFLEQEGDRLFCSDNGTKNDAKYLNQLLNTYDIGTVEISDCKNIRPKIHIYHPENIPCLADGLFIETQNIPEDICTINANEIHVWKQFRRRLHGFKVDVIRIEPYIARYIKVLNACGISTDSSCDGHHAMRGKLVVEIRQPYMKKWHINLWNEYLYRIFPDLHWNPNYDTLTFKVGDFNSYLLLNQVAAYLYERRKALRTIRYTASREITNAMYKQAIRDGHTDLLFEKFLEKANSMLVTKKVFEEE